MPGSLWTDSRLTTTCSGCCFCWQGGGTVVGMDEDAEFERFWKVYPRKIKKGYARRCYATAVKREHPENILAGAIRYAEHRKGQTDQYTLHPSSWLNAWGWEDDYGESSPVAPKGYVWLNGQLVTEAHFAAFTALYGGQDDAGRGQTGALEAGSVRQPPRGLGNGSGLASTLP